MKSIVIYHSQTGFTRRYAQWIAQAVQADCVPLPEAAQKDLSAYDTIVFGSWARAGGICKLDWFKRHAGGWSGKRLIVFCVGASPADSPDITAALKQNFTNVEWEKIHVFYCPGGLNYEKMPLASRLMMKLFCLALKAKKEKTEAESEMARIISASYDLSDRKYIEPILACME